MGLLSALVGANRLGACVAGPARSVPLPVLSRPHMVRRACVGPAVQGLFEAGPRVREKRGVGRCVCVFFLCDQLWPWPGRGCTYNGTRRLATAHMKKALQS